MDSILVGFLENLQIISDKHYQQRVWIEGVGPEVHDFEEAVCDFFDLGEALFTNPDKYGISKDQYQLLIKFCKLFKKFF
jgi:hypothetical protein